MKWTHQSPAYCEKQIEEHFLLFPMRIGNECRWLEICRIEYELCFDKLEGAYWKPIRFVDETLTPNTQKEE